MPEEINRLVTDAIADLLWTPSPDGDENLRAEGVPAAKIERIGNIMIDSFEMLRGRIEACDARGAASGVEGEQLRDRDAAPAVERRPAGEARRAGRACSRRCAAELRIVFAVHPRTRKRLAEFGLLAAIDGQPAHHGDRAAEATSSS